MLVRGLVAMLMVLFLAACSAGDAGSEAETTTDEAGGRVEAQTGEVEAASAGDGDGTRTASRQTAGLAAAPQDQDGAAEGDAEAPAAEPLPDAPPLVTGDRIIKEGTISVEVAEDTFDRSFARVVAAARQYGGDVIGSSTRTNEDGDTVGSVTVRVPVEDFENLIVSVGEIGTIRHRDIGSQDVTAEFTDLESRLRHERAQERFYLGLLDDAESVDEAIAVQQQLVGIQERIEKIQGRLNVLEDRTTFSTLTVELFEPGLGGAVAPEESPEGRPSLAHYWDIARDAFVNVVGSILVVGLFALPLLLMAAAALGLWMVLRRRPVATAPHSAPARDAEDDEEPLSTTR